MKGNKISALEKKTSRQYFILVLPGFIIFTIGLILPLILAIRYSFTTWDGMSPEKPFVGFQNYIAGADQRYFPGGFNLSNT